MRLSTRTTAITLRAANGSTETTTPVLIAGKDSFRLRMPASFTGTNLGFQVSDDNVTYQGLYDEGNNAVALTVAAGRTYALPEELKGHKYLKLTFDAQAAAREFVLSMHR